MSEILGTGFGVHGPEESYIVFIDEDGEERTVSAHQLLRATPREERAMKDETGCQHITSRIRAESVHSGMKVGARVSETGDLWWCVGCGGLFTEEAAKHPIALPSQADEPRAVDYHQPCQVLREDGERRKYLLGYEDGKREENERLRKMIGAWPHGQLTLDAIDRCENGT
jgi:hypothetical protein